MQRYILRFLIALLTFCLGISVFKTIKTLEDVVVEHFYTASEISSVTVPITDPLESNEIYRVILRDLKDSRQLVVRSESQGYVISEYEYGGLQNQHDEFSTRVQRFMPDAENETLNNYLAVNEVSGLLTISAPELNIVLVRLPQPDRSDQVIPYWQKFYKTYPNSLLVTFSQVGFNNRHDQAFVYAAQDCGGLCGVGTYILLAKRNGRWSILRRGGLWVS